VLCNHKHVQSKGDDGVKRKQITTIILDFVWGLGGLEFVLGKVIWDWVVYPIMQICLVIGACGCFQCKVVGISNFALIYWVIGTYFQWKVVGV